MFIGRWQRSQLISQDPAGLAGSGTTLYAYANENPVNYTDPTGLASAKDILGVLLGLVAAVASILAFFEVVGPLDAALLAALAVTTGGLASLIDGPGCINGDTTACGGLSLGAAGFVGGLAGGTGSILLWIGDIEDMGGIDALTRSLAAAGHLIGAMAFSLDFAATFGTNPFCE